MNSPKLSELKFYVGRIATTFGHRAYNPALCWHEGRLVCAYRFQDDEGYSHVAIGDLDPNDPTAFRSAEIELDFKMPEGTHIEDPRLISIGGVLTLFVATVKYEGRWAFVQRAFAIGWEDDEYFVVGEIALPYYLNGQPGVVQKNWTPFDADGKLGIVYSFAPFTTIVNDEVKTVRGAESLAKNWRWGSISGRSPALQLANGDYLAVVGGHMQHGRRGRQYWMGAALFNPVFGLVGISEQPLVWASPAEQALVNPWDPKWNPVCIFPTGIAQSRHEPSRALIAVGVNDSFCDLLEMPLDVLTGSLVHPSKIEADVKATVVEPELMALSGSQVLARVKTKLQPVGEPGGPYTYGDTFLTTRDRVAALGDLVEEVAR